MAEQTEVTMGDQTRRIVSVLMAVCGLIVAGVDGLPIPEEVRTIAALVLVAVPAYFNPSKFFAK